MNEKREQGWRITGVAAFKKVAVGQLSFTSSNDSDPSARRYPRTRLRPSWRDLGAWEAVSRRLSETGDRLWESYVIAQAL